MKKINLISILIMVAMMITATSAYGQKEGLEQRVREYEEREAKEKVEKEIALKAQEAQELAEAKEEAFDKVIKVNVKSEYSNLTIKEIALSQNQTRLSMTFKSDKAGYCYRLYRPGDGRGFAIAANGTNYRMTAQKGMRYIDVGYTCLQQDETLPFYLYFDALPEDVEKFDVIWMESDCKYDSWCIQNVSMKETKKESSASKAGDKKEDSVQKESDKKEDSAPKAGEKKKKKSFLDKLNDVLDKI